MLQPFLLDYSFLTPAHNVPASRTMGGDPHTHDCCLGPEGISWTPSRSHDLHARPVASWAEQELSSASLSLSPGTWGPGSQECSLKGSLGHCVWG